LLRRTLELLLASISAVDILVAVEEEAIIGI
jgi:hypothetical protein